MRPIELSTSQAYTSQPIPAPPHSTTLQVSLPLPCPVSPHTAESANNPSAPPQIPKPRLHRRQIQARRVHAVLEAVHARTLRAQEQRLRLRLQAGRRRQRRPRACACARRLPSHKVGQRLAQTWEPVLAGARGRDGGGTGAGVSGRGGGGHGGCAAPLVLASSRSRSAAAGRDGTRRHADD